MRRRGFLNVLVGVVALGFERVLRVGGPGGSGETHAAAERAAAADPAAGTAVRRWVRALRAKLPCMPIRRLDERSIGSSGRWAG